MVWSFPLPGIQGIFRQKLLGKNLEFFFFYSLFCLIRPKNCLVGTSVMKGLNAFLEICCVSPYIRHATANFVYILLELDMAHYCGQK